VDAMNKVIIIFVVVLGKKGWFDVPHVSRSRDYYAHPQDHSAPTTSPKMESREAGEGE
jgi:hypothetical protein